MENKLPAKENLERLIRQNLVFPKDKFDNPIFSPSRLEEDSFSTSVVERRLDSQLTAELNRKLALENYTLKQQMMAIEQILTADGQASEEAFYQHKEQLPEGICKSLIAMRQKADQKYTNARHEADPIDGLDPEFLSPQQTIDLLKKLLTRAGQSSSVIRRLRQESWFKPFYALNVNIRG